MSAIKLMFFKVYDTDSPAGDLGKIRIAYTGSTCDTLDQRWRLLSGVQGKCFSIPAASLCGSLHLSRSCRANCVRKIQSCENILLICNPCNTFLKRME